MSWVWHQSLQKAKVHVIMCSFNTIKYFLPLLLSSGLCEASGMVEVELDDDDTEATVEAKMDAAAAAVVVVVESQFWLEVGVVIVSAVDEAAAPDVDVAPAVELVEVGGAELDWEEPALATTAEYCCISMTAASSNT